MADLISRAAVLNDISDLMKSPWYNDGKDGGRHVQYLARKDAVDIVKALCVVNQPAVDAAPVVHARWHELKDGTEECTNCLGLCPHEENYNGDVIFNFGCEYCPWCGAKMDGEADG